MSISQRCRFRVTRGALGLAFLAISVASADEKDTRTDEAACVRFLIISDTDAREGSACALDASNLKAVLMAGLRNQKLDGRFSIHMLEGAEVSPAAVLKHYQDLRVGPNDAVVCYYSGHGTYHTAKGHLLTFIQGDLARASLLAAMQQHKPRLAALITDCCAIVEGEPVVPKQNAGKPAAGKRGPQKADPPATAPPHPPRPGDSGSPPRPPQPPRPGDAASSTVPAHPPRPSAPPKDHAPTVVAKHPPRPENYRPPPPFDLGPDDNAAGSAGVTLHTADGRLALKALIAQTDGELMRHLFYRHTGLVDINGCKKGTPAYATARWGGGLFTITFLSMQKEKAARFDANRNGLVEWTEFFAQLRSTCDRNGTVLSKGQMHQAPEASQLAKPSFQVAGK
jgi:hypothetical protein